MKHINIILGLIFFILVIAAFFTILWHWTNYVKEIKHEVPISFEEVLP